MEFQFKFIGAFELDGLTTRVYWQLVHNYGFMIFTSIAQPYCHGSMVSVLLLRFVLVCSKNILIGMLIMGQCWFSSAEHFFWHTVWNFKIGIATRDQRWPRHRTVGPSDCNRICNRICNCEKNNQNGYHNTKYTSGSLGVYHFIYTRKIWAKRLSRNHDLE